MHIADMKLGHLGANAIVGGGIPSVVGAGLAARHRKSDNISVAFLVMARPVREFCMRA